VRPAKAELIIPTSLLFLQLHCWQEPWGRCRFSFCPLFVTQTTGRSAYLHPKGFFNNTGSSSLGVEWEVFNFSPLFLARVDSELYGVIFLQVVISYQYPYIVWRMLPPFLFPIFLSVIFFEVNIRGPTSSAWLFYFPEPFLFFPLFCTRKQWREYQEPNLGTFLFSQFRHAPLLIFFPTLSWDTKKPPVVPFFTNLDDRGLSTLFPFSFLCHEGPTVTVVQSTHSIWL